MDILKKIEDHYQFSELKWRKNEEIIVSSTGIKRIRYWDNKQLLDWHVQWRDDVSKHDQFVIDRMIRTKDGEPAIPFRNGWLTLHDEITDSYSVHENESKWALLLAEMLTCGCSEKSDIKDHIQQKPFSIEQCFQLVRLSKHIDEVAKVVLEKSCTEAKKRHSLAEGLLKHCNHESLPVLDRIKSVNQGKKIYDLLFWVGGSDIPEIGYRGIRRFLEEWLCIHGNEGVKRLLTKINNHFYLAGAQGLFLLAECLIPWELYDCLRTLERSQSEGEAYIAFEKYNEQWESSRKLVEIISGWLDEKREKVAT